MRVFRDESGLSAAPALWPSIEEALASSGHLILLACPEAAASKWVSKEIDWFRANRDSKRILIALTDGELIWEPEALEFRYDGRAALPEALKGAFAEEPAWVDFRDWRHAPAKGKSHRAFVGAAAGLVGAIRNLPKDEIVNEELRRQRQALTIATTAVGLLALLSLAAGWQWYRALQANNRAVDTLNLAAQTAGDVVGDVTDLTRTASSGSSTKAVQVILKRLMNWEDSLAAAEGASTKVKKIDYANHGELAAQLRKTDPDAALREATIAKDYFSALQINDPHDFDVQHQVIESYMYMGWISQDRNDARALEYYRAANKVAQEEVADDPKNGSAVLDLMQTHLSIGDWELRFASKDSEQRATEAFKSALGEAKIVANAYPDDKTYQSNLKYVQSRLNNIRSRQ